MSCIRAHTVLWVSEIAYNARRSHIWQTNLVIFTSHTTVVFLPKMKTCDAVTSIGVVTQRQLWAEFRANILHLSLSSPLDFWSVFLLCPQVSPQKRV